MLICIKEKEARLRFRLWFDHLLSERGMEYKQIKSEFEDWLRIRGYYYRLTGHDRNQWINELAAEKKLNLVNRARFGNLRGIKIYKQNGD